ncbi:permease [Skermanella stibiiresistens SB22]|uniref:Probable membrane transporter protein n=1 Tax=Skermanella stibiiresistens SB22 TaxID=1385369 RepID=W9HAM1_9PROT|nr:sulfite exporter TauE/SafE family protein [Skermanella stibiiresistens]EWY41786.1 permease [Skermanella stibiiresistens SB22]
MTLGAFAIIAAAVVLAAFVQGMIGVGFALILVPVVALVDPTLLPSLVLALMIPLNIYVLWRERASLDWRGTGWITAGRLVGTFGGLAVLLVLVPWQLDMLVGALTIAAVLVTLAMPVFTLRPVNFLGAGLVSGITETATGIGGPPLALLYQHQSGPVLRATLAACFLVGQIFSLIALVAVGQVAPSQLSAALLLIPALAGGACLSHLSHHLANGALLRRLVQAFAVISGLVLIARSLGAA